MKVLIQQLQESLGIVWLNQQCWSWLVERTLGQDCALLCPQILMGTWLTKMRTNLKEDLSSSHKNDRTAAAGAWSQSPGVWGWESVFSSHLSSPETHYQNPILPSSDRAMTVSWILLPLSQSAQEPAPSISWPSQSMRWLALQLAWGSLAS